MSSCFPSVPVPDSRMPDACFKTQLFLHSVLRHWNTRAQTAHLETFHSTASQYQQSFKAKQSARGRPDDMKGFFLSWDCILINLSAVKKLNSAIWEKYFIWVLSSIYRSICMLHVHVSDNIKISWNICFVLLSCVGYISMKLGALSSL